MIFKCFFSGPAWPHHQNSHLNLPKIFRNHFEGSRRCSHSRPGWWEGKEGSDGDDDPMMMNPPQVALDIEPRLRATFPKNAVKKKIKVTLGECCGFESERWMFTLELADTPLNLSCKSPLAINFNPPPPAITRLPSPQFLQSKLRTNLSI